MVDLKHFDLSGRVAVITGAGKGLGARIAAILAAAGADTVLADIDRQAVEGQCLQLESQGYRVSPKHLDVTDESAWKELVAETVHEYGRYDILVNNAGVEDVCLLEDMSLESFRRVQDVNVIGTFLGLKHTIAAMKPGGTAGRGGSIVNLSSVAGMIGFSAVGAYCAAKGGIRLLSKAAANECAQLNYGIRVNSLHPGLVLTDMGSNLLKGFVDIGLAESAEQAAAMFESVHPMGFGEPDNIAHAVHYLASDASGWVNGAEQVVDGGWVA